MRTICRLSFFTATFLCLSSIILAQNIDEKSFLTSCKSSNLRIRTYKTQVKLEFSLNNEKDLVTFNADIVGPDKFCVIQHAFKKNLWDKWMTIDNKYYHFYGKDEIVLENPFPNDLENKKRTNESLTIDKYISLFETQPDRFVYKEDSVLFRYQSINNLENFPMFIGDLVYNIDIEVDRKTHLIKQADIKSEGKLGNGQPIKFAWIQKFSNHNEDISIIKPKITAEPPENIARFYADYGKLLMRCGNNILAIAEFLSENTQNIVECSNDKKYIERLVSLKNDTEEIFNAMSSIKIPDELLEYHSINKEALAEYNSMLQLLIQSSTAANQEDKKIFLDKAAEKVQTANQLAQEAEKIRPTADGILKKYIR